MNSLRITIILMIVALATSCVEKPNPTPKPKPEPEPEEAVYLYPFGNEAQNITATITIQTDGSADLNTVTTQIPHLKYNKSWLLMLTQDDCKQAAYSCTWAAINGKPLSSQYYYNASHLAAGDLPPDVHYLGKTLGSTDGAGNEVRFSFSTTLAPEESWINNKAVVDKGKTSDYYRFFMKEGLLWEDVAEMCNYGVGIAFHDVKAADVNNASQIAQHYTIAQDSIKKHLAGRWCKFLAEPNGNETYLAAMRSYAPIQTFTTQRTSTSSVLYPLQVDNDLNDTGLFRIFYTSPEQENIKAAITAELAKNKEQRKAVYVGVHGTNDSWADLLLWLNNNYGKDGDNSLWMPSHEEYFEYNYYRSHATVQKTVSGNSLTLTVSMPSGQYFYYPALTINIKGLKKAEVTSVSSGTSVKGLSYADYTDGMMVNIDCRHYLVEHATHYIEKYEKDKTASNKADALYFVNMLKASEAKTGLLNRLK